MAVVVNAVPGKDVVVQEGGLGLVERKLRRVWSRWPLAVATELGGYLERSTGERPGKLEM